MRKFGKKIACLLLAGAMMLSNFSYAFAAEIVDESSDISAEVTNVEVIDEDDTNVITGGVQQKLLMKQ